LAAPGTVKVTSTSSRPPAKRASAWAFATSLEVVRTTPITGDPAREWATARRVRSRAGGIRRDSIIVVEGGRTGDPRARSSQRPAGGVLWTARGGKPRPRHASSERPNGRVRPTRWQGVHRGPP